MSAIDIEHQLISAIPKHWQVRRIKEVAELTPSNVDKLSVEGQRDVLLCNYVDTYKNDKITKRIDFMKASATDGQIARLSLTEGDVTITKDSESPWDIAVPAYVAENIDGLVCGYHLTKISPDRSRTCGAFLTWALRSKAVNLQFALSAKGVTRYGLTSSAIADGRIPFPALAEQIAIASYLDVETARIDALIVEKNLLVTALAELKKTVVFEAITLGLRKEVQRRESGLAWIEKIPEHWNTASLKRCVRLAGGHTPSTTNAAYWDGTVPWFSPKDMKSDELADSIDHVTDVAVSEAGLTVLEAGTTMIVVRGMILAHTFPVCVTTVQGTLNQDMKALIPDETLDKQYLPWLLRGVASLFLSLTDQSGHGTKALRTDRFMSERLPIPPIEEQLEIVAYLEAERKRIDDLFRHVRAEIDLLIELRLATITDAVLGRIDVSATGQTKKELEAA